MTIRTLPSPRGVRPDVVEAVQAILNVPSQRNANNDNTRHKDKKMMTKKPSELVLHGILDQRDMSYVAAALEAHPGDDNNNNNVSVVEGIRLEDGCFGTADCFGGHVVAQNDGGALDVLITFLVESKIQSLTFDAFALGDAGTQKLLKALQGHDHLAKLHLSWNGLQGDGAGRRLGDFLQRRAINIDNKAQQQQQQQQQMTSLGFNYNRLGLEGVQALQPGIQSSTSLRALYLYGCGMGDAGLHLVVEAVRDHEHLEILHVGHNRLTADHGGLASLTTLLNETKLKELNVAHNEDLFRQSSTENDDRNDTANDDDRVQAFTEALAANDALQVLRCKGCVLTKSSATLLTRTLCHNTTLETLSISLSPELAYTVTDTVATWKGLRYLDCHGNLSAQKEALVPSIQRNSSLFALLGDHGLDQPIYKLVESCCRRNHLWAQTRAMVHQDFLSNTAEKNIDQEKTPSCAVTTGNVIPRAVWSKTIKRLLPSATASSTVGKKTSSSSNRHDATAEMTAALAHTNATAMFELWHNMHPVLLQDVQHPEALRR